MSGWFNLIDGLVNFFTGADFLDEPESRRADTPPAFTTVELDDRDNGRSVDLRLLDLVAITLPAHPNPGVTARLVQPDSKKLLVFEDGTMGPWLRIGCRPLTKGQSRIDVEYLREDGTVESEWSVRLSVKK